MIFFLSNKVVVFVLGIDVILVINKGNIFGVVNGFDINIGV